MHRPAGQPAERNHSKFLDLTTHYVGKWRWTARGWFAVGGRG
jgi:hypothetical protein